MEGGAMTDVAAPGGTPLESVDEDLVVARPSCVCA